MQAPEMLRRATFVNFIKWEYHVPSVGQTIGSYRANIGGVDLVVQGNKLTAEYEGASTTYYVDQDFREATHQYLKRKDKNNRSRIERRLGSVIPMIDYRDGKFH